VTDCLGRAEEHVWREKKREREGEREREELATGSELLIYTQ
jgi:hypothetical protein